MEVECRPRFAALASLSFASKGKTMKRMTLTILIAMPLCSPAMADSPAVGYWLGSWGLPEWR
jgi:hypothetical protein